MVRFLGLVLVIGSLASASSGCASYNGQALRTRTASSLLAQDNFNNYGLVFAAQMPEDAGEITRTFDCNPADYNYLVVEVFLENRSQDANFEVRASQATFELADGTRFVQVPNEEIVDTLGSSGWITIPWWPIFIFPGFIALSDVWDANARLEEDLRTKVLADRNVAPGSPPVQGVLFFRPADEDLDLDEIDLREATIALRVTMRSPTVSGDSYTTQIHFTGPYDLWKE